MDELTTAYAAVCQTEAPGILEAVAEQIRSARNILTEASIRLACAREGVSSDLYHTLDGNITVNDMSLADLEESFMSTARQLGGLK